MYILHQRLRAQNVSGEKERKVLQDVMTAMFSPTFVNELFKPQVMYSMASTKQIFEKLAHSSIMRLNTSSMDKLFDLMAMGVKYQLMCCSSPQQFLHVTFNHLQTMRNIVGPDSATVDGYLQRTEDHLARTYGPRNFGSGHWLLLKSSLLTFFQGKKIKVSLFLQKKVQSAADGTLFVPVQGRLPMGTEPVGTTRTYDGRYLTRAFMQPAFITDATGGAQQQESRKILSDPWDEDFTHGHNMYSTTTSIFGGATAASDVATKDLILRKLFALLGERSSSESLADSTARAAAGGATGSSTGSAGASGSSKAFASQYADGTALGSTAARAESKLNAALFGTSSSSAKAVPLTSLLSGAAISGFESKSGGRGGGDADLDGFININIEEIDATADAKTFDGMLAELNLVDAPKAQPKIAPGTGGVASRGGLGLSKAVAKDMPLDDDDDDLLSLMDSAK